MVGGWAWDAGELNGISTRHIGRYFNHCATLAVQQTSLRHFGHMSWRKELVCAILALWLVRST